MYKKSIRALLLILVVFGVAVAVAAAETISGKIEMVDVKTGKLVVETDEDVSKEMKAPKEMLQGLKRGDEVTITIEEGTIQSIEKNDEDA